LASRGTHSGPHVLQMQNVPASFLQGKRGRKKRKRREDRRSLLKDTRMLALSAYAHQFKILLGRIDSLAPAAVSGARRLSPNAKASWSQNRLESADLVESSGVFLDLCDPACYVQLLYRSELESLAPPSYLGQFTICIDPFFLFLAFAFVPGSADVAAAITHFISFEVGNLVDAL
jgi:hypothetical protein